MPVAEVFSGALNRLLCRKYVPPGNYIKRAFVRRFSMPPLMHIIFAPGAAWYCGQNETVHREIPAMPHSDVNMLELAYPYSLIRIH